MILPTHLLASTFGVLGNIISFCVFLSPLPTFCKIYQNKSTQGFHSVPYSVALFSCMLLLYYGNIKPENGTMIVTINSIGCAIETAYIVFFLIYATRESLISTVKVLVIFNTLSFTVIVVTTLLVTDRGPKRVNLVGWICSVFSVCVFAAPLSIMRMVIRTKSVEYMPFFLSFFLTLCAIVWFFYGLLINDYFVATPNVLGFVFGIGQMVLYMIYKGKKMQVRPMVQPQDEITPIPRPVVADAGEISEMKDNGVVELRVEMEMQEKPMGGDEGGGEIIECMGYVCGDLDGEKTKMSFIA
ncbi:bidirectional sugar transporter SWEET9-like [Bidens hawaiensis]|uniref:bidirectional sugar transporter SWEET9-like n=1 Tax=Bidens hawaiensis TaxID=980011 RepID=UPI004049A831